MRASDISILQQLVTAANDWRSLGITVGVELNILTTQIHDQTVILAWDESESEWIISTQ